MADGIAVRMDGIDDLRRAADELRRDLRLRTVRAALVAAAQPIARSARTRAPVLREPHPYRLPGTVAKSIVTRASRVYRGNDGQVGVYVAVRKRKGLGGKASARNPFDPFYWRFLEFGTRKMPRRPFILPAFEANKDAALAAFKRRLAARIAQANTRRP